MVFSVEAFVADPSMEALTGSIKKVDLLSICNHYGISATSNINKSMLIQMITEHLIDNDVIEEVVDNSNQHSNSNSLEVLNLQIRLKELEIEDRKRQREHELLMRQYQSTQTNSCSSPDISNYINLIPKFDEEGVDSFFAHFETIAINMSWPRNSWANIIQCKLYGRANEAYAGLSIEEAKDYETVKTAILKAYELVPEAYRQKFRSLKKTEKGSYVEFARSKEQMFDRWCSSKNVQQYNELKNLILLEEFKACLPQSLRLHIENKNCDDQYEAGKIADNYTLIHRHSDINQEKKGHNNDKNPICETENFPVKRPRTTCAYCKKKGHIISECWFLKKKQESPTEITSINTKYDEADSKKFQLFISEILIGLSEKSKLLKLRALRDTGASLSLMQKNAITTNVCKFTGDYRNIRGITGEMKVPLYRIYMKSALCEGYFIVGMVNKLPIAASRRGMKKSLQVELQHVIKSQFYHLCPHDAWPMGQFSILNFNHQ